MDSKGLYAVSIRAKQLVYFLPSVALARPVFYFNRRMQKETASDTAVGG
jgi:hypothetical protein